MHTDNDEGGFYLVSNKRLTLISPLECGAAAASSCDVCKCNDPDTHPKTRGENQPIAAQHIVGAVFFWVGVCQKSTLCDFCARTTLRHAVRRTEEAASETATV